jgi:hypothetical protein
MPPLNLYARVRFLFPFAHETAGAARTRLSLRPLVSWGVKSMQSSGASRRENAELFLDVIACDKRKAFAQGSACDEAIHLSLLPRKLDCFASLAMTLMDLVGLAKLHPSTRLPYRGASASAAKIRAHERMPL